MADKTGIEWADATWNPIVGCSIVSKGCTNCYAMKVAARLLDKPGSHYFGTTADTKNGGVWTGRLEMAPDHILKQPLHWTRPRRIFVNSMGDLFHESVPADWIDRAFAVMALAQQHTFMILTKRPERMREYMKEWQENRAHISWSNYAITYHEACAFGTWGNIEPFNDIIFKGPKYEPLENVWLGVSIEDQDSAEARIPPLLSTPAAVRFVSAEPLLGSVDLTDITYPSPPEDGRRGTVLHGHEVAGMVGNCIAWIPPIDWVICGGESGPDARPMHPDWARSLRNQCIAAGVPFFFKQWGEWKSFVYLDECMHLLGKDIESTVIDGNLFSFRIGKKKAGRALDGRTWDEIPS